MNLHKIIAELQAELERLNHAIEALERLSAKGSSRRGRPPAWMKERQDETKPPPNGDSE